MPIQKHIDQKKRSELEQNVRFFEHLKVEFMVHELKDPVAVIETILHALMDHKNTYGPLTQRQEDNLKRALLSSKKVRQMLYDLLEIGRGQAKSFICRKFIVDRVTLESLFNALEVQVYLLFEKMALLQTSAQRLEYLASHGIQLFIDKDVENLEVVLDETKYRQIVTNLIKNGLCHRNQALKIRLQKDASHLMLTVQDDGPGVASEHHQLVFEQYKQIAPMPDMSRSGHGLGLAGAQILARCLGGDIVILSQKGQGATFLMTLPILNNAT